jgi:hypothetical protein
MQTSLIPKECSSALLARLVSHAEHYCQLDVTTEAVSSETENLAVLFQTLTRALLEDADATHCSPAEAAGIVSLLADVVQRWREREKLELTKSPRASGELFCATAEKWRKRSHHEALVFQKLCRDTLVAYSVPRSTSSTPVRGPSVLDRLGERLQEMESVDSDLEGAAIQLCAQLILQVPSDALASWFATEDDTQRRSGRDILQLFAQIILAAADARILRYVSRMTRYGNTDCRRVSAANTTPFVASTSCRLSRCSDAVDAHRATNDFETTHEAVQGFIDDHSESEVFQGEDVDDLWPSSSARLLATDREIMDEWESMPNASSSNCSDVSTFWRTSPGVEKRMARGRHPSGIEQSAQFAAVVGTRHSIALPTARLTPDSAEPTSRFVLEGMAKHVSLATPLSSGQANIDEQSLLLGWFPYHAAAYALLYFLESCAKVAPDARAGGTVSADPLYAAFSTPLVLPAFAFVLRNDIVDRISLRLRFPPMILEKAIEVIRRTNEPRFAPLHRLWQRAGLSAFLAVAARRYSELGEIPVAMRATDAACILAGKREDCFGFLVTNRPELQRSASDTSCETPEQQRRRGRRRVSLRVIQSERRVPSPTQSRRLSWRSRRRLRSSEAIECGIAAAPSTTDFHHLTDASESPARPGVLPNEGSPLARASAAACPEAASDAVMTEASESATLSQRLAHAAETVSESVSSSSSSWLSSSRSNRLDHLPSGRGGATDALSEPGSARSPAQPFKSSMLSDVEAPTMSEAVRLRVPLFGCCSEAWPYGRNLRPKAQYQTHEMASTWSKLLRAWRDFNENEQCRYPPPDVARQTQRLVRRFGIPDRLRRHFWPLFLQVERRRNQAPPNFYRRLLRLATLPPEAFPAGLNGISSDPEKRMAPAYARLPSSPVPRETLEIIDRDVTRTLCNHRLFWRGGAALGLSALRNVLRAYACLDPMVGYCQGMSSITGALYIYAGGSEERCFFMLLQFMQGKLNFREFFLPGFVRLRQSVQEFTWLLQRDLPSVAHSLQAKGISPMMYADKWYLTALLYNFPFFLVSRIWDCMLFDGHIKVLHRATLTLMKRANRAGRLARNVSFEDLLMYLQHGFATDKAAIPTVDIFMGDMWQRVSFSRRQLRRLDTAEDAFVSDARSERLQMKRLSCWPRRRRQTRPRHDPESANSPKQAKPVKAVDTQAIATRGVETGADRRSPEQPVADQDDVAPQAENSGVASLDSFSIDEGAAWKRKPPMRSTSRRGRVFGLRSLWRHLWGCMGASQVPAS